VTSGYILYLRLAPTPDPTVALTTVKQAIKALKSTSACSIRSSEWSEAEGVLYFHGKIYIPPTADIQRKIVALHHDSHIAGHPGRWKTLELVARNYWWPHMSRYIGQYTATYDLCLRTLVQRQLPTGHLESLPTPDTQWDTVSVDFIVELPESDRYNAIMVVVRGLNSRLPLPTHPLHPRIPSHLQVTRKSPAVLLAE